ncbi:MAG: PAS domain-containing protein, partial [Verrucomicrobiota bacterium]|nr:PAS domain-containing protein [Verrucomicrobiota bacterium]
MKNSGLEKILGRIEDLDSVNLGILVQRLARERKMQETVFNTIQDGVIFIDWDGLVKYPNDAALGLIGLKGNDIGVTRLWKMVPDLAKSINLDTVTGKKKSAPVLSREIE